MNKLCKVLGMFCWCYYMVCTSRSLFFLLCLNFWVSVLHVFNIILYSSFTSNKSHSFFQRNSTWQTALSTNLYTFANGLKSKVLLVKLERELPWYSSHVKKHASGSWLDVLFSSHIKNSIQVLFDWLSCYLFCTFPVGKTLGSLAFLQFIHMDYQGNLPKKSWQLGLCFTCFWKKLRVLHTVCNFLPKNGTGRLEYPPIKKEVHNL